MRCPFCTSDDTKVLETRLNDGGTSVRRRRICNDCNKRYSTREIAELELPRIIKRNQSREVFDEKKLCAGLVKALEKRPVATELIEQAVIKIKHTLATEKAIEIDSSFLGELVMNELRILDEVAYIRFASVYRQFQDIEAFKNEIDKLIKK